ncbi:hypothetical protein TWF102_011793 [Orbilia oligospora]|uniref:LON peptidase N-terminal domain and RING finger protein 3 n=1 Tax=Orbilia oligospora TaxID=2813651 RepID=A0A7C8NIT2_ORBOL|nr:hypothetical protein TWF102_011793 [Orbilia oligospora]KAF3091642.1 hypothetical protein TWF103_011635 [Orbilia oligospora]KAF3104617.1 hypothetical protein TWF706_004415 [Orbilia oligospora]KAF3129126.1 hypothetical protein TWF594_011135 [Orbilia oligospora]
MNVDSNTGPSASDSPYYLDSIAGGDVSRNAPQAEPRPELAPGFESKSKPRLNGNRHLREFVRLLQCELCHKILRQPLALPCGETLCRSCLPPFRDRRNISYPNQPNRRKGFLCPFQSCKGQEHSLADCNLNITLANILAIVDTALSASVSASLDKHRNPLAEVDGHGEELDIAPAALCLLESSVSLLEAYELAQAGLLPFNSDFPTQMDGRLSDETKFLEQQIVGSILLRIRPELDCQVCYNFLRLPITTSCGHTFCQVCLKQVRDRSNLCPFCRRSLSPYQTVVEEKANRRMRALLSYLFSDDVAARDDQAAEDPQNETNQVPIFACAMTFPRVPMFLHIFEPRYRLMLQKVISNGSRSFGMVSHRRGPVPSADGDFDAPFTRYGTMLYVTDLQMFPDGRSLVETIGTYRFKIVSYTWQDGYPMAMVERIEDIAYADEENMEMMERMLDATPGNATTLASLSHLPTQELHRQGLEFVNSMRTSSTGWFADRIINAYGQPPQDPAIFPFWVATLLPVHEREKYLVLVSTSVRERLKLVTVWMRSMQQRSWYVAILIYNSSPASGVSSRGYLDPQIC